MKKIKLDHTWAFLIQNFSDRTHKHIYTYSTFGFRIQEQQIIDGNRFFFFKFYQKQILPSLI